MRKSIYLTLLLTVVVVLQSCSQGLNFGIKGGVNFAGFNGSSAVFDSESITSYHAGLFVELGFTEKFSIQPEILYSTTGANISFEDATRNFKNKLGYISVPVMAKFYLIPNRLSIDLGPQLSYLWDEENEPTLDNSSNYDISVAGGITFRVLGPLFIQGRYNHGLNDIKSDADVSNRVFQLSAGLRF
ncbi:porin family protein [Penaeicola halotolerans]|uniref:porin family protein n=1 Tax=Penaeicola halotolerans TaxID=2793196 RepID=UPI001CF91963|nr:porin family protein [Penaeicola halotolerans]